MNENNRAFIKVFWSYAIVIIIPILILGFVTTGVLFKKLATDTEKLNLNIIEQSVGIFDTEMEKTLTLFFQIEKNTKIQNFANEKVYNYGNIKYDLYDVMAELQLLKTDNPVFREVGFYLNNKDYVVTNSAVTTLSEFYTSNFSTNEVSFDELNKNINEREMRVRFLSWKNTEGDDFILCHKRLNADGLLKNASVFAILDKEVLISKMKLDGSERNIEFALIDDNIELILKSEGFNLDHKKIANMNEDNIIPIKSNATDCKYIYKLPKGGLVGEVGFISLIFCLLLFVTVVVSIALAFFHMHKIRRFFLGVFNEGRGLEENLDEQLKNARERILANLLHNVRTDAANNSETVAKYGIDFKGRYFAVATVAINQTYNSDIYSSVEELAWSEFNIVVKERLETIGFECEVVRTGKSSYSYILNFNGEGDTKKLKILPLEFQKNYNISVSFGVGDEVEDIEKLYASYEGAVSALRFAIDEKSEETVFYSDISDLENGKIYYTGEKERQLMRSIKLGKQNEVAEILDEIYNVNFTKRRISYNTLKRIIYNLSLMIYKILDEEYERNEEKHDNYARVCQDLFRNENIEEAFATLREICFSICADVGEESGEEAVKKQIEDYISKNYSDVSLSLDVLAEHLGISYYYLSRLFKEYIGTNFVSYLTLVRLEKAKELLKSTNDTIEQIAEKSGFLGSNSLIRAFKKYYNTTPGKFRKI